MEFDIADPLPIMKLSIIALLSCAFYVGVYCISNTNKPIRMLGVAGPHIVVEINLGKILEDTVVTLV